MKYDVFISYSSHDQKVVEGLSAYLEQHKIRCFVAYRDIPRGVVWARAIVEALDESRMMVVVFSEHFNNSDQVDREIELASEDKKPILTFRISNDAFKGAKKYYLKNLNWIDAFPEPDKVFKSVAENVATLLEQSVKLSPVTYQVGDYYDDGKKQGVVFAVSDGGRHGKIVSLDEEDLPWCIKRIIVGTSSDSDGKSNTDKVIARADSANYPAFQWCREKGQEWYLPSKEELELLLQVRDKVNKTLRDKSMEELSDFWNWSSTEKDSNFAWGVLMNDGRTGYGNKDFRSSVRAVSAF